MIQSITLNQELSQRQEFVLSQSQIASQEFLALSGEEREREAQDLIDANPMSELEAERGERQAQEPRLDDPATKPKNQGEPTRDASDATRFSHLLQFTREYGGKDTVRPLSRARRAHGERDSKMDALANHSSQPPSAYEYLHEQWKFVDVSPQIRRAGERLLEYIEQDGYLRTPLEELATRTHPALTLDELKEALDCLQRTLDPPGIAARDLEECLILQLNRLPDNHKLDRVLIERHLQDIASNRYPAIVKRLGIGLEEIKQAVSRIHRLDPLPGRRIKTTTAQRIRVDVTVEKEQDSGDYQIQLTRTTADRIRLCRDYEELRENLKCKGTAHNDADRSTLHFLEKGFEPIKQFIKMNAYRNSRLEEVAEAIFRRQELFLEYGPAALKPMRMAHLATQLGCHESTICRAVSGKWVQTPRGVFPLRFFFGNGRESVKEHIRELIVKEYPSGPLSDAHIAERLKTQGIDVERRTVTKYREQMGIANSRLRRRY